MTESQGYGTLPMVGFAGPIGCGKNTAARLLGELYGNVWQIAFADPVREGVLAMNPLIIWDNIPQRLADVVKTHGWDVVKRKSYEARRLLQTYGTEAGRHVHGENCWVMRAQSIVIAGIMIGSLAEPESEPFFAFTDVRFPNEGDWLNSHGQGYFWIDRPGLPDVPENQHASESFAIALKMRSRGIILNDGSESDFKQRIEEKVGPIIRKLSIYKSA